MQALLPAHRVNLASGLPMPVTGKSFVAKLLQLGRKTVRPQRASQTLHLSAVRLRRRSLLPFVLFCV